jgi:hypothetical protein
MSHQEALTIIAEVDEGQIDALKRQLGSIREHGGDWSVVPFAKLTRVHFAQFVVLDAATDLSGAPLPARLVLLTTVDAPLAAHLDELSTICGEGMDAVFSHCRAYPAAPDRSPATRRRYLHDRSVKSDAVHINRRGRTVQQIRQEEVLRRELNTMLDAGEFSGHSPLEIRNRIVESVRGRSDLRWALQLPAPPALSWRLQNLLHGVFNGLLALVVAVLLLLGAPLFLWLLRRHEKQEIPDTTAAPATVLQALRDDEDYWAHNQFVVVGCFKPGLFRKITTRLILGVADYATRHIYNRGTLSGLNTIHFARWARFDGGRRMVFASIYDGTIESYMNDFIDKAAWGVNAIFSNGDGFPPTVYMVGKGISDEKAYKRFLPTRLVHSCVWYSAYPHLTTKNIANNEAIRSGLSGQMTEEQAALWLARFGTGNHLPESGRAARMIDSLPWDRICRRWN